MDKKMASILLASLLERIQREGGTGTVSSHEVLALKCAISALDPDASPDAPAATGVQTNTEPVQVQPAQAAPPPSSLVRSSDTAPEVTHELPPVRLVLDALELSEPEDADVLLCLDFGTAMSKAFASAYPNDQLDLELGAAAGRSGYTLPSSVFISDDGRAYFGFEAIEQSEGLLESGRQRLDSIKAWISQQTEGSLDGDRKVLSKEWNPTPFKLTQGDLLRIYLAYLTDMANQALATRQLGDEGGVGRYIKRRFARPCWPNPDQAQWADKLMRKMLAEAQILADTFSDRWSGGLTVAEIKSAINEVQRLDRLPEYLIGEGVPEPVAVAAGAIADAHNMRDAFMVVDVGAGTTDFGLFVATRKPDDDETEVKVFQVPASIQGLMQAGDKVDGILRAYICRHESIDENDTSGRLIRADLGRKIRSLKEALFKVGALDYVLSDGTVGSITLQEFLADPTVLRFGQLVEDGFKKSLAAVDDSWLRWLAMDGVKLHVVLTGGSSTLPMMQALATGVIDVRGYKIMRAAVNPQPIWLDDFSEELSNVYPQLAVAIGGAADEMPETYTAPLTFGGGAGRTSYVAGRLQVSGS